MSAFSKGSHMSLDQAMLKRLTGTPETWLITGVAGFIGSNLLETLLKNGQQVVGLDNFFSGYQRNLDQVRNSVGAGLWSNFKFIEGDIRNQAVCQDACAGVTYVLHHAALGSVPHSIQDPVTANSINIDGFMNMLIAARDAKVKRFVYAASAATYGDDIADVKVEDKIGKQLSPYAVTKYVNELYADVFAKCYGLEQIGLRYFNIFGPRQDADGAYASVIPKWIKELLDDSTIYVNGDGETSRDFCYIENVVHANLQAATIENPAAINQVYNIGAGERTTLNELYKYLQDGLAVHLPHLEKVEPVYRDFRSGDVRHSLADISKAKSLLGYAPNCRVQEGLVRALGWYLDNLAEIEEVHVRKT